MSQSVIQSMMKIHTGKSKTLDLHINKLRETYNINRYNIFGGWGAGIMDYVITWKLIS